MCHDKYLKRDVGYIMGDRGRFIIKRDHVIHSVPTETHQRKGTEEHLGAQSGDDNILEETVFIVSITLEMCPDSGPM